MNVSQELALLRAQLDQEKRANEELKLQRGDWLAQMERTLRESQDALLTQNRVPPVRTYPPVPIPLDTLEESQEDAPTISPARMSKRAKRGIDLLSPPITDLPESPKESYEDIPPVSPSKVPPLSPTGARLPLPRPVSPAGVNPVVPVLVQPVVTTVVTPPTAPATIALAAAPAAAPVTFYPTIPTPVRVSSPVVLSPIPVSPCPLPAAPPLPVPPLPLSPEPNTAVPAPLPYPESRCLSELPPPRQEPVPLPAPLPPAPTVQHSNVSPPMPLNENKLRAISPQPEVAAAAVYTEPVLQNEQNTLEVMQQRQREAEMATLARESELLLQRQAVESALQADREMQLLQQEQEKLQLEADYAALVRERELLAQAHQQEQLQRETDIAALQRERDMLAQEKKREAELLMLEKEKEALAEQEHLQKREAELAGIKRERELIEQERLLDQQRREADLALLAVQLPVPVPVPVPVPAVQLPVPVEVPEMVRDVVALPSPQELPCPREVPIALPSPKLELEQARLQRETELAELKKERELLEQSLAAPSRYVPPEVPAEPSDVAKLAWERLVERTNGELTSTELALMSLGTLKELVKYYGIVNPVDCARIEVYWRLMHDKVSPNNEASALKHTPLKVAPEHRPPWRSVNYRTPRTTTPTSASRTRCVTPKSSSKRCH
eukprot:TRINITY_DN24366_c0_g1_i1.p1 TRINITY_DN24366_c0_g1~~TRINITY_DN24366_c0_g1_i1.p1  ORF type:complete len:670 (+),score=188.60 TRINITY_DN24366_c0_g1_i1:60-2069(+)